MEEVTAKIDNDAPSLVELVGDKSFIGSLQIVVQYEGYARQPCPCDYKLVDCGNCFELWLSNPDVIVVEPSDARRDEEREGVWIIEK